MLLLIGLIAGSLGLLALFNLTNPLSAGPLGVLAAFVLIYGVSFSALLLIARLIRVIYRAIRPHRETVVDQDRTRIVKRRLTLIVAALSAVPIFLISLNSIGQLRFTDILLIVVIEILAIFYIVRRV